MLFRASTSEIYHPWPVYGGYISDYVAVVDQRKAGLKFTVIMNVSLNSQRFEYVE